MATAAKSIAEREVATSDRMKYSGVMNSSAAVTSGRHARDQQIAGDRACEHHPDIATPAPRWNGSRTRRAVQPPLALDPGRDGDEMGRQEFQQRAPLLALEQRHQRHRHRHQPHGGQRHGQGRAGEVAPRIS